MMGFFSEMTWEPSAWDKPGYNPKNGKVRALFRWEGCQPFRLVSRLPYILIFSITRTHIQIAPLNCETRSE
jgi:hypothetical protein